MGWIKLVALFLEMGWLALYYVVCVYIYIYIYIYIYTQQLDHSKKSELISKFCHNKFLLSTKIYLKLKLT